MSYRQYRLLERHQRLDELLRMAQSRLYPDQAEIGRLKKMKLALKDRLASLRRR